MYKIIILGCIVSSLAACGNSVRPEEQATSDIKRCSAGYDRSKMTEAQYKEYTFCMIKSVNDYKGY